MSEISSLLMDDSRPLGNTQDAFGLRALHVNIGNAATDPIPVIILSNPGFNSCSENTVTNGSFDVHSYTVDAASVISLSSIVGSTEGTFKCEIDYAVDGVLFTRLATRFSDAMTGIDIEFTGLSIPAGGIVKITRTNTGGAPSFISTSIQGKISGSGSLLTEGGDVITTEDGDPIEL